MIARVTVQEVLAGSYQTIGLPNQRENVIKDHLLAGLLRRSAGIHCPCSRVTLRRSILECLQYLTDKEKISSERIDDAIEGLLVGGDLLELNDVVVEDPTAMGTWVFAAPPSFVVRKNGDTFLFGIVSDQDVFLPTYLSKLITFNRYTRVIASQSDLDIPFELLEQGLQQISEEAWLKCPKPESAQSVIDRFEGFLNNQPPAANVSGLRILDQERSVSYYKGRWTSPKNHSGIYIARRPQEFGTPIWCLTSMEDGEVTRFLDLPHDNTRWRGCDVAWHLQMAIDYLRGLPQQYRRTVDENEIRLDFFSPIPLWFQRRLTLFGRQVDSNQCLLSYTLNAAEAQIEEQFLQQHLWHVPQSLDS